MAGGNEVRITVTSRDRSGPGMDSARRRSDQLGKSVQRAGEIAQGIIAAQFFERIGESAQRFLGNAASSASRLEQAVGGTQAVFGDARAAIDEFGKQAASTAGLSEAEFRDMSTLIGGQFKRMTGDVQFASDASIQLTQVGADLAATYGGTTKEAMDAFAAALRGEADPAERFNLNLKASVVGAKAVEMGLATSTTEVDDAARAQAILALIMEQSADAQGQFAEEADTAAVAQQKLNAEYENAQAALGQALLPAIGVLSQALTSVLQAFQDLPGPVQAVVGGLVLLGAGVVTVTSRVAPMIVAMQGAGVSMASMSAKARAATLALGPLAIAVGLATAGWIIYSNRQRAAADATKTLSAEIDLQTGKLTDNGRAIRAQLLLQDRNVRKVLDAGLAEADLIGAINGEADALERVNRFKADAGVMTAAYIDLVIREWQEREHSAAAEAERERALRGGTSATDKARLAQQQATAAALESANAVEKLKEAWQESADGFVDAVKAYTDAGEDLRDDQKVTADMVLEQLRRQVEAQDSWHTNMIELAQKVPPAIFDELARLGPEGAEQVALLNSMTDAQLAEWVANMGRRGRDAGGNLISEVQHNFVAGAPVLAEIARQKGQQVADQIAAGMRANGTTVEAEARRIGLIITRGVGGDRTIRITPVIMPTQGHMPGQFNAHGGLVGGLASGGISGAQAGGPRGANVLVGEQGPEIAELPFGTRVIPSGQSQAMMSAGLAGISPALLARGFVRLGEVTDAEWRTLLALGWQGRAGDNMEALYPPMREATRAFDQLGRAVEAEGSRFAGANSEALDALAEMAEHIRRGGRLFEDLSFIRQRSALSDEERAAVMETFAFLSKGGRLFEDLTFEGMKTDLPDKRRMELLGPLLEAFRGGRPVTDLFGGSADALMRTIKDAGPRGSALYDVFRESDMSMRRAQELFDIWRESAEGFNATRSAPVVNVYVQGSIRSDRDLVALIRDEFLNGGFRGVLEGVAA